MHEQAQASLEIDAKRRGRSQLRVIRRRLKQYDLLRNPRRQMEEENASKTSGKCFNRMAFGLIPFVSSLLIGIYSASRLQESQYFPLFAARQIGARSHVVQEEFPMYGAIGIGRAYIVAARAILGP